MDEHIAPTTLRRQRQGAINTAFWSSSAVERFRRGFQGHAQTLRRGSRVMVQREHAAMTAACRGARQKQG